MGGNGFPSSIALVAIVAILVSVYCVLKVGVGS